MCAASIIFSLNDGSITGRSLYPSSNLSEDRVFYVYEWFRKDTGEIVYVGKGTGDRIKEKKRNRIFNRLVQKYECDVRIVDDELTELEALEREQELISQRWNEGNVLTNFDAADGIGFKTKAPEMEYLKTPEPSENIVLKHYFDEYTTYDPVDENHLLAAYIQLGHNDLGGLGTEKLYVEDCSKIDYGKWLYPQIEPYVLPLIDGVRQHIEQAGGRVYKSKRAKSVKCIIHTGYFDAEKLGAEKEDYGVAIYHLCQVLDYINDVQKGTSAHSRLINPT